MIFTLDSPLESQITFPTLHAAESSSSSSSSSYSSSASEAREAPLPEQPESFTMEGPHLLRSSSSPTVSEISSTSGKRDANICALNQWVQRSRSYWLRQVLQATERPGKKVNLSLLENVFNLFQDSRKFHGFESCKEDLRRRFKDIPRLNASEFCPLTWSVSQYVREMVNELLMDRRLKFTLHCEDRMLSTFERNHSIESLKPRIDDPEASSASSSKSVSTTSELADATHFLSGHDATAVYKDTSREQKNCPAGNDGFESLLEISESFSASTKCSLSLLKEGTTTDTVVVAPRDEAHNKPSLARYCGRDLKLCAEHIAKYIQKEGALRSADVISFTNEMGIPDERVGDVITILHSDDRLHYNVQESSFFLSALQTLWEEEAINYWINRATAVTYQIKEEPFHARTIYEAFEQASSAPQLPFIPAEISVEVYVDVVVQGLLADDSFMCLDATKATKDMIFVSVDSSILCNIKEHTAALTASAEPALALPIQEENITDPCPPSLLIDAPTVLDGRSTTMVAASPSIQSEIRAVASISPLTTWKAIMPNVLVFHRDLGLPLKLRAESKEHHPFKEVVILQTQYHLCSPNRREADCGGLSNLCFNLPLLFQRNELTAAEAAQLSALDRGLLRGQKSNMKNLLASLCKPGTLVVVDLSDPGLSEEAVSLITKLVLDQYQGQKSLQSVEKLAFNDVNSFEAALKLMQST